MKNILQKRNTADLLNLLWCHIADGTMDSLTVIPALYVLKDCPPGFSEILICVEIDIFLFHYGMEGFYAGIIIGIPFTAE